MSVMFLQKSVSHTGSNGIATTALRFFFFKISYNVKVNGRFCLYMAQNRFLPDPAVTHKSQAVFYQREPSLFVAWSSADAMELFADIVLFALENLLLPLCCEITLNHIV